MEMLFGSPQVIGRRLVDPAIDTLLDGLIQNAPQDSEIVVAKPAVLTYIGNTMIQRIVWPEQNAIRSKLAYTPPDEIIARLKQKPETDAQAMDSPVCLSVNPMLSVTSYNDRQGRAVDRFGIAIRTQDTPSNFYTSGFLIQGEKTAVRLYTNSTSMVSKKHIEAPYHFIVIAVAETPQYTRKYNAVRKLVDKCTREVMPQTAVFGPIEKVSLLSE